MKINREQLVELLAQQTGLPKEQVKEKLVNLISRIHNEAEDEGGFDIDKFGTFRKDEGELAFTPADELQTEINNKYAGMEPIELIGAYKESEKSEDVGPIESDIDEDSGEEEMVAGEHEETDVWPDEEDIWSLEEKDTPEEPMERTPEAANEDIDKPSSETPEDKTPETGKIEASKQQTESAEDEEDKSGTVEEPGPPQMESTTTLKGAGLHGRDRKRSSTSLIMIAAASIIIIAIAVWLAFDTGVFSNSGITSVADTDQQVAATTQPDEQTDDPVQPNGQQDAAESGEQAEPENRQEQQGETGEPSDSEPEASDEVASGGGDRTGNTVYGLKGNLNEKANDGYTIVVYSLQNQQKAREIYNNLQQEGYRMHLVSAMVNGNQYWRVGLGQFQTIEDAEKNAEKLPEPYSGNYFIKRIR